MANWTTQLRDSQSDDPFLFVYRKGAARLIVVGAQHDNDPEGKTFALIRDAFTLWEVNTTIVEGIDCAPGLNAVSLQALAAEALDSDGKQPNGELIPAVQGAVRAGANVLGGEASDRDVLRVAQANGVELSDLLGFYVLRVIPQWLRDGTLASTRDPKFPVLVEKQLARSASDLGLLGQPFSGFAAWAEWYRETNRKRIEDGLNTEEVGPLADGPWATNRFATAIAKARDSHLLGVIEKQIVGGKSVVVVFGGSHALILQPSLTEGLGEPCYAGPDVAIAKRQCLT